MIGIPKPNLTHHDKVGLNLRPFTTVIIDNSAVSVHATQCESISFASCKYCRVSKAGLLRVLDYKLQK